MTISQGFRPAGDPNFTKARPRTPQHMCPDCNDAWVNAGAKVCPPCSITRADTRNQQKQKLKSIKRKEEKALMKNTRMPQPAFAGFGYNHNARKLPDRFCEDCKTEIPVKGKKIVCSSCADVRAQERNRQRAQTHRDKVKLLKAGAEAHG